MPRAKSAVVPAQPKAEMKLSLKTEKAALAELVKAKKALDKQVIAQEKVVTKLAEAIAAA